MAQSWICPGCRKSYREKPGKCAKCGLYAFVPRPANPSGATQAVERNPWDGLSDDEMRFEILSMHAAVGASSPHELLGVPSDAGKLRVEQAYRGIARRYDPERHPLRERPELLDLLNQITLGLAKAYEELCEAHA